jgi:hypothetical protein
MSIRDKSGKLAITPGAWEYAEAGSGQGGQFVITEWFVRRPEDDVSIAADIIDPATDAPSQANAALIAEAGTVTNETDRTPAELRDLCRELRAALSEIQARATNHPCFMAESFDSRDMEAIFDEGGDCCDWTMLAIETSDALAKSEGI